MVDNLPSLKSDSAVSDSPPALSTAPTVGPRLARVTPRTLRLHVIDSLRSAIKEGVLPVGSPLVEARIAEEMGVSRAPVREALRKLEEEGLVVSIPYKGTYVTEVSHEAIHEILTLRTVLEGFAAERALPRIRSEGLPRFSQLIVEMGIAAESSPEALVEVHLQFHRALYELAGHALLLQIWDIMESQLRLYLRVNHQTFERQQQVVEAHRATIELLESGDVEAIKTHLAVHIAANAQDLLRRRDG